MFKILIMGAGTITGTISAVFLFILTVSRVFGRKAYGWIIQTGLPLFNIINKLTWRDYFESNLRAATAKPLERPFGTTNHYFSWDRLIFNPRYQSRLPINEDFEVGTDVVLGPRASQPLHLKIPIMIGGMSYGGALSLKAKTALAKASAIAGTAANSGNGPLLIQVRLNGTRYILQYSRGFWSKADKYFKQADMIEIGLGQGAWGSTPVRIEGKKINQQFAERLGTIPGLDVLIEARLPEVEDRRDWINLINTLKEATGGVPVAVKIGGTHYLERELDLILAGEVDIVVLDGAEGGTHACPPILMDDCGLPTLPVLCRAVKYFEEHGLFGKVSLITGGGLATAGDFAKCLALGADAVFIGTIAALTMVGPQITKTIPWEPPTGLIFHYGKDEAKYDPDAGARHFSNFLLSSVAEMQQLARSLGKTRLSEIDKTDLVALDPLYASMAGVEYLQC